MGNELTAAVTCTREDTLLRHQLTLISHHVYDCGTGCTSISGGSQTRQRDCSPGVSENIATTLNGRPNTGHLPRLDH